MVNTSNAVSNSERPGGTQLQSTLSENKFTIEQILSELQAEFELDSTSPNIGWITRTVSVLSQLQSKMSPKNNGAKEVIKMVTLELTQDVETMKISEGNVEGRKSITKASRVFPTFTGKRMIEYHERIDQVEDLLGALRFSCGLFTF